MGDTMVEARKELSSERKPELYMGLDEVDREIEYLRDVVETVIERITRAGVVGPERPEEGKLLVADTPYTTDLGRGLSEKASQIRYNADRLVDLRSRLEL